MTVIQSVILGILQGIAEFLPISSSGHLAVCQHLFGLEDVPLLYDVMLHIATLVAVCIFFRKKIARLFCVLFRWIFRRPSPEDFDNPEDLLSGSEEKGRKTIIAVIISSFVTAVIGIVTSKLIPEMPLKVTAAGFIVTACLLFFSSFMEKKRAKGCAVTEQAEGEEGQSGSAAEGASDKTAASASCKKSEGLTWLQALIIGAMQGVGTLPGISRSGSTIAGAQFCKVPRDAAGEYSFIVSIPAILGAFLLTLKDYLELRGQDVAAKIQVVPMIFGCFAAFVFGYIALFLLMKIIKKGKLEWFACYLIPLGIAGLIFF